MTSGGELAADDRVCAGCGEPVTAWPFVVVPQPDGTAATYHDACSPWADEVAVHAVGGLELLSDEELRVVRGLVRALVDHDEVELRRAGALAEGKEDPYAPTRNWRLWPQVHLVSPPGDPVGWEADVVGTQDEGWSVDLRMWTVQEDGPSDLVLHLDVTGAQVLYRGMWT